MHAFQAFSAVVLLASSILVQGTCSQCPLGLKLAIAGAVEVGKPLQQIKIPGGVRNVSPVIGGRLSGVFDATVEGGIAYPSVIDNGTVSVPEIIIYGTTADNASFLIKEAGVGSLRDQNTRITLEVGGEGAPLMNEFILASVIPSQDHKTVVVKAYVVERSVYVL